MSSTSAIQRHRLQSEFPRLNLNHPEQKRILDTWGYCSYEPVVTDCSVAMINKVGDTLRSADGVSADQKL